MYLHGVRADIVLTSNPQQVTTCKNAGVQGRAMLKLIATKYSMKFRLGWARLDEDKMAELLLAR